MLKELNIKNYALIDHLQITFADGFSVMTGETGSGKSIILGALSLILGERADLKSIRNSKEKCVIEGIFTMEKKSVSAFFEKHDLDFDTETILRREINPQGKSRAFINDTPVGLAILKEISEQLIDIHSQNATLLLNNKSFIFEIIDSQLKSPKLKSEYNQLYEEYKSLSTHLENLIQTEKKSVNDKNYFEFLLDELSSLPLEKALENDLEAEFNLLSNAETIKSTVLDCLQNLSDDHSGINKKLQSIVLELSKIKDVNSEFLDIYSRTNSSWIELKELESDLSRIEGKIEVDNNKLSHIEGQLSSINSMLKKHNLSQIEELVSKKNEIQIKLDEIGSISDLIAKTIKEKDILTEKISQIAQKLSDERKQIIPSLELEAKNLLIKMKMKNAEIKFDIEQHQSFNKYGIDNIELLAKTNLGGSFDLLKKIASGGESSRIMLAIKSLQTQSKSLPTIIFDEIDTGVSGDVATHMGDIMLSLGVNMQVISITHLPQIAAKGQHHYKVYKEEQNKTTLTKIVQLGKDERLKEVAEMLSSANPTKASLENAKELLNQ